MVRQQQHRQQQGSRTAHRSSNSGKAVTRGRSTGCCCKELCASAAAGSRGRSRNRAGLDDIGWGTAVCMCTTASVVRKLRPAPRRGQGPPTTAPKLVAATAASRVLLWDSPVCAVLKMLPQPAAAAAASAPPGQQQLPTCPSCPTLRCQPPCQLVERGPVARVCSSGQMLSRLAQRSASTPSWLQRKQRRLTRSRCR